MNLIVIGVNHQTAPVEVREQFAIPEARLPEAVMTLAAQPGIEEALPASIRWSLENRRFLAR